MKTRAAYLIVLLVVARSVFSQERRDRDGMILFHPEITISQAHDKKQALVKAFYDGTNKNYESVAFIDNRKVIVIAALSSRTKVEYEKALSAFRELVASYFEFTLSG